MNLRHSKAFEDPIVQLRIKSRLCSKRRPSNCGGGGGADVPKALTKPVTHLENYKGLKTSWKYSPKNLLFVEIDFRSYMVQGIDGEFNFLPKGGLDENRGSLSAKSMNNKTPMIDTEPISVVHPSNVYKNIIDSYNTSLKEDELSQVGPSLSPEAGEKSKVAGDVSTRLDVDRDPDIHGKPEPLYRVVAHITPPSWKQYSREISIEQLCDIHDRAYMRQAVLDNMLNSSTQELISALHKARASYDAIRE
ncbi:hypothetical protein Tco_1052839 [Tanacetum coccineum]